MATSEPVPGLLPGAPSPLPGSQVVDWITRSTTVSRTITSAIPADYARYATIAVPDGSADKALADTALVDVLRTHSPAQPWWLGYLDTGAADTVAPPTVMLYAGWHYALVEAGPESALTARRHTPWHSALPELIFPRDRSWLVSTLWDDDWRCVGGPAALVEDLLARPELDVRDVSPDQDATPPGRTSR